MFGVLLSILAAAPIIVEAGTDVVADDDICTLREAVLCLSDAVDCAADVTADCDYDGVDSTIEIAVATVTLQSTLDVSTAIVGTVLIRPQDPLDNVTIQNATAGQRPLTVRLDVATDVITFQNLTIIGGVLAGAGDVGGAVFIRSTVGVGSAQVIFEDVTIENGVAAYGGGIFAGCGNLRLALRGANVTQNGHPTGVSSPRSLIGGGIFMSQESAQLEIDDGTVVSNNRARDMGAGIALFNSDLSTSTPALDFKDGLVLNNQLTRGTTPTRGAGIAAANTLPGGTVEDAVDAACMTDVFPKPLAGPQKLALGNDASIASNGAPATTDSGGGLSAEGCSNGVRCWVEARGASVRNNNAGLRGGGMTVRGYALTVTDQSTISDNESNGSGGGVYFDGVDQDVTAPCQDATLSLVVNLGVCIHNSRIAQNTAAEKGGGLYLTKSTAGRQSVYVMGNARIGELNESSDPPVEEGNSAGAGGGIYAEVCTDASTNQTCWLYVGNSAHVDANTASNGAGGGIYADDYAVTIDEATLRANDSSAAGGAIFVTGSDGDAFGAPDLAADYPATCLDQGSVIPLSLCVLGTSVLFENSAGDDGGAIAVLRSDTVAGRTRARVRFSSFSANVAGADGGGLSIAHTGTHGEARLSVTSASFADNIATRGGGLFAGACPATNSTCTADVISSSFIDNDAAGEGGGVAVTNFVSTFDRMIARGNDANLDGGGFFFGVGASSTLTRAAVASNVARSGGGIFNAGTISLLENVTLDGNTAVEDGGGLANTGAVTMPVHLLTITENTAAEGGGIHTGTELQLVRSILLSNSSACAGDIGSLGFNLLTTTTPAGCNYTPDAGDLETAFTADQLLGALAVNLAPGAEDPLLTRALLFHPATNGAQDNPAVNAAGDCSGDTDGRGLQRGGAERGACDIGAYESSLRINVDLASPLTPTAGGASFDFTVEVAIADASPTADGVVVRLELPAVVRFSSVTAAGYSCVTPAVGATGTVTCTRDTPMLETTPDHSLTITATIAANAAPGSIHPVTVRLLSTLADSNPTNNSDAVTLSPQVIIDLGITKTDNVTSVVPGSLITYVIVADNAGPSDALGVELSDVFAGNANVSLVDWSCTGACTTASGGAGDFLTTTTLPAGESATYSLRALVDFDAAGETIENTVDATAPVAYAGNRIATAEDDDTVVSNATPVASLSATKIDTPDPVLAGEVLSYVITLANAGPQAVRTGAINIALGSMGGETTFEAFDTPATWNCSTVPAVGEMGSFSPTCQSSLVLLPGASVDFGATVRVLDTATGTIPFGATLTTKMDNSGGTITDAPAGDTTVETRTDLGVALTSAAATVAPGATFDVVATVTNAGPSPSVGATFAVTVPAGLALTSGAVTLPTLAAAASTAVTLTFSVDAAAVDGAVAIVASVGHPNDANVANDSASLGVTIATAMGGPTGPTDGENPLEDEMIVRGGVNGCGCRSTGEGDVLLAAFVLSALLVRRRSARRGAGTSL